MIEPWVTYYIGTVFEPHGRGPRYDCWGLVVDVMARHYGVVLPDARESYPDDLAGPDAARAIAEGMPIVAASEVDRDNSRSGDLVLMRMQGLPRHIGVHVGDHYVLHIDWGVQCVCQHDSSAHLRRRVVGYYRID